MRSLDAIGIAAGTDKHVLQNNYLSAYERELAPYRNIAFNLIEIGVFNGASLRAWEEWFPEATIVGIDINGDCIRHSGGRRVVEIGSQADAEFLRDVAQKYPPTVIIDDGSHRTDHIQLSFATLFPFLLTGGCYVVEDIMNPHPPGHALRGSAEVDTAEYFIELAKAVLLDHLPADAPAIARAVKARANRVTFINRAVVVGVRSSLDLDEIEEATRQSRSAWNWHRFASLVMTETGDRVRALRAAEESVRLNASEPRFSALVEQIRNSPGPK